MDAVEGVLGGVVLEDADLPGVGAHHHIVLASTYTRINKDKKIVMDQLC